MFKFLGEVISMILVFIFGIFAIYVVGILVEEKINQNDEPAIIETDVCEPEETEVNQNNIIQIIANKGENFFIEYKNMKYEDFETYISMAKSAGFTSGLAQFDKETKQYGMVHEYVASLNTNQYILLCILFSPSDGIISISMSNFTPEE